MKNLRIILVLWKVYMRKSILSLFLVALLLTGCGQNHIKTESEREDALDIVVTVFPAYDFARAVAGDLANVTLLLPPGAESHSYEPTPADILAVQNCDLFLYLGANSLFVCTPHFFFCFFFSCHSSLPPIRFFFLTACCQKPSSHICFYFSTSLQ